jgi:hypothetical protein
LVSAVERFSAASRNGEYYEGFNVNSRNFMETSDGTKCSSRSAGASLIAASPAPSGLAKV